MREIEKLTTEEGKPPPSVAEARAAIIRGVLTYGLIPAKQLKETGVFHMPSYDDGEYLSPWVYGCALKPPSLSNSESFGKRMFTILYEERSSILPVMLERHGECYDSHLVSFYSREPEERECHRMRVSERKLAEKRMAAAFLVVYGIGVEEIDALEECVSSELDDVPVADILYLIMPKDIYEEYVRFGG